MANSGCRLQAVMAEVGTKSLAATPAPPTANKRNAPLHARDWQRVWEYVGSFVSHQWHHKVPRAGCFCPFGGEKAEMAKTERKAGTENNCYKGGLNGNEREQGTQKSIFMACAGFYSCP